MLLSDKHMQGENKRVRIYEYMTGNDGSINPLEQ